MKVAATIAAHNLQLAIDGFNDVGGLKRFPHGFGIFQEGEIVLALFAEFTNPCWIGFSEAIAKFFELAIAHFNIPR